MSVLTTYGTENKETRIKFTLKPSTMFIVFAYFKHLKLPISISILVTIPQIVYTVKPAVAVTSIKRDPPLSGHFRVPPNDFECKCTYIKRVPVQRGQRSAKFAQKR